VGATYASKKYNQYYYGVSGQEAARSGLPAYIVDIDKKA
jgi:hypothetical protein